MITFSFPLKLKWRKIIDENMRLMWWIRIILYILFGIWMSIYILYMVNRCNILNSMCVRMYWTFRCWLRPLALEFLKIYLNVLSKICFRIYNNHTNNFIFYFIFFCVRYLFNDMGIGEKNIFKPVFFSLFFSSSIFSVFRFFDEIKQKRGDVKMYSYLTFYECY